MALVFNADGTPVKEIGGAAIAEEGYIAVLRPATIADVPLHLLRLMNGEVIKVDPTPQEMAAQEEARIQDGLLRAWLTDRFEIENRLRAVEGKQALTRDQFISATKLRLGI